PVRELVVVGVAVVEEAVFLHEKAPRVDAGRVTAVPADRTFPHGLLERGDGARDLRALGGFRELEMLDPSPTVTTDIETRIADRPRRRRIALERQGAAEYGHR